MYVITNTEHRLEVRVGEHCVILDVLFPWFSFIYPTHTSVCLPHREEGSETATREEQPDGSQTLKDC